MLALSYALCFIASLAAFCYLIPLPWPMNCWAVLPLLYSVMFFGMAAKEQKDDDHG